ncbi:23S rRNA (uracil(1939)-C(5))-methyltransferase RlmD [Ruoffia tabacinasalis]|uniref:23S rRNA (uracil(1939)-C(5))-methyltransferase RlmD n=1 Tax=Ruoffia tabacinasalis TaxID=87458 RepID=UPI003F99BEBF
MRKGDYPTEVLDVEIDYVDSKGRGFVHYTHAPDRGSNGKTLKIITSNVVPGDVVRVTVDNAKGRYKAVVPYDKLLKPGPTRNLDMPTHFDVSGAAPLQYMKYPDQLEFKANIVKESLEQAGFNTSLIQPIIGMDEPNRYRNKMELSFGPTGELGMHQQGNYRKVIDLNDSIIAPKVMIEVKHIVSQWQKDNDFKGYDKDAHTGLLRNLMMRTSFETGELMVVVYATEKPEAHPEAVKDLTDRLSEAFPSLASLVWIEYTNISGRIQSEESFTLYGRDYIYDELGGYRYRIWHDTFFQPNPVQAEKMVDYALEMADVNDDMRVLDLFCGVGTFSLPFAKRSKELAGIEIVETSIESAKRNAKDNGLDNTFFMASDARRGMKELPEIWGQPDLLLLDPPRSGAGGKVMRSIGRLGTDKVIYVSCNPKSLAEDLVWLRDFGYELKTVQPIDQFPHTPHVETIVLMQKVKG